ncbi:hypothetical protein Bcell_1840 [Evansella cellulosilytica DSM 2522]|uniref:Uncharacterized protein n=1 Tax=Evansella cellulosilytica (strain ATCC 21833 / DSM 2522 / FERM P-1141 / JCM 9156 / N-4) TaxID=649639 RepID=E6TYQ2_EVAC2|nr:hypothetical protein Bcell_1840 [Evansella cellulosilytica DSM 2522]
MIGRVGFKRKKEFKTDCRHSVEPKTCFIHSLSIKKYLLQRVFEFHLNGTIEEDRPCAWSG